MSNNFTEDNTSKRRSLALSLAAGCLIGLISTAATVLADDTEIFFGKVDHDAKNNPNIMFILDTSDSMDSSDVGYVGTRMQRLRSAMHNILDSSTNVNIGLMRFNGHTGGGPVLFPVTDLDKKFCIQEDCGTHTISSQITNQSTDINLTTTDGKFTNIHTSLVNFGTFEGKPIVVNLQFPKVNIPSGATITSAKLEFNSYGYYNDDSNLTITAKDAGYSALFLNQPLGGSDTPTSNTVSWKPETWSKNKTYSTPDLTASVQELVDRDGWCGNNNMVFSIQGTGTRVAYDVKRSANKAPILRVTYTTENIPDNKGCVRNDMYTRISSNKDDAIEWLWPGTIYPDNHELAIPEERMWFDLLTLRQYQTRLRFTKIDIPQGATIIKSDILFYVYRKETNAVEMVMSVENTDNAPPLVETDHWISQRPLSGLVGWKISADEDWGVGAIPRTPSLNKLVQVVVDLPGWQRGNAIAIHIGDSDLGVGSWRTFTAHDKNPVNAPHLSIFYETYVGSEPIYITARQIMKNLVDQMRTQGGTPIVSAYYEAAQYLRGGAADYGTERGFDSYKHQYHRVSHPDSYTGGTVSVNSQCTSENPDDINCLNEKINGSAQYISPIKSSCQTSHVVLLSDGAPTSNTAAAKVKNLIGANTCSDNSYEACGTDLAHWLTTTDQLGSLPLEQSVNTHTIGFNDKSDFLSRIAIAGGANYYNASSSEELTDVFQNILFNVFSVDTSFVAPGTTVSQFNRLTHSNDIYFALFKPDKRPSWSGNLKRYQVGTSADGSTIIKDKNGTPAVDEETGFFSSTAHSFWSPSEDGGSVPKGGAASKISLSGLSNSGDRNVFTYIGNSIPANGVNLTAIQQRLHEANPLITTSAMGLSSIDIVRRTQLLQWARGVDVQDIDQDGSTTDVRQQIGDPMHSSPTMLHYANGNSSTTTIFIATNQGLLHAIEQEDGSELYAFMPQELLSNLNYLFENQSATIHPYGLDGDLSTWHDDTNDNGIVDSGESAYLYIGMRRGGQNYYAFDVSNRLTPKLLWQITGGASDFSQLGQSWSKPVPTSIMINNEKKNVLIFAGGYDSNQDPNPSNLLTSQTPDSIGNAIYIVDAKTGARLWVGQGKSGGNVIFNDMDYSIPSDIRVIDIDANGLADQMYVGDMGGQLWRFDITPNHQSGEGELVSGGVIARLNNLDAQNARRFYNEPDVALITQDGKRFLSVSIGSGWRAHPLNQLVKDRFYMIRSNSPYSKPDGYGKNTGTANTPVWQPITEGDLSNVTDDLEPDYNPYGWMLEMENTGEKVLSKSITINNQLVFTSYEPSATVNDCEPIIGGGAVYAVNVMDGSPALDLNDDQGTSGSTKLSKQDRKKVLTQGGIPPSPTALLTGSGSNVSTTILVSTEQPIDLDFSNLTQRTYWQDNGRGNESPTQISESAD